MRRGLTWIAWVLIAGCVGAEGENAGDAARTERDATRPPDGGFTLDDRGTVASADAGAGGGAPGDAGGAAGGEAPDTVAPDAASPADGPPPGPPIPLCRNGIDDDADGHFDQDDPGCSSEADPTEEDTGAAPQCFDGLDQDGNGLADYPEDPGCLSAGDEEEASGGPTACSDGQDNDGDGLVDRADPGCAAAGDRDEADPPVAPQCHNGVDDDADGAIDFPDDGGCEAVGDPGEAGACGPAVEVVDLNAWLAEHATYLGETSLEGGRTAAGCGGAAGGEVVFSWDVTVPTDRVTFSTQHPETTGPVVMYVRHTCGTTGELDCNRGAEASPGTRVNLESPALGRYFLFVDSGSREAGSRFALSVQTVPTAQCRNVIDDDGDGLSDAADPGCTESDDADEADPVEPPVCANGLDDDQDGQADYGQDPDCRFAGGDREIPLCPDGVPMIAVGQAGGRFDLPAPAGGQGAASGSCDAIIGGEAVLVLDLDSPSEVTVEVQENGVATAAAVYVRRACSDPASELACRGSNNRNALRVEELPRGQSFVFVELGFAPPAAPRQVVVNVQSVITECNDAIDNDFDARIDLDDTGCERGRDETEGNPPDVPQCANGVDDDADGQTDYPNDPHCLAAGDPEERQSCLLGEFGGVCVNWLSPACIPGMASAICAMEDRGRLITYAEFMQVAQGGWVRPDANYHTMSVDQYPDCGNGIGNTGIPGWGEFNLFNCGDDQNYCNRAVMCVRD